MAFVFRSQTNDRSAINKSPDHDKQSSHAIEKFNLQQQLTRQMKKKNPYKGLAMVVKSKDKQPNQNTNLSIIYKQQQTDKINHNKLSVDRRQHFFKSNIRRNMFYKNQSTPIQQQYFCIDKLKNQEVYNQGSQPFSIFTDTKLKIINKSVLSIFESNKKKGPTPSIPQKRNKYGYVVDKTNNSLSLPKLVSHYYFEGTNTNMPGPADYDAKKLSKRSPMFNFSKERVKAQKPKFEQNIILQNQAIKPKTQKKKKVCKIPKTRDTYQRETLSSQEQQSQYQQNCIPGPGEYQIPQVQKKDFRSKKQSVRKIFFKKMPRFSNNLQQFQQITLVNQSPKMKIKHNSQPFLSKCPRIKNQGKKQYIPGPGYYQNRSTMQHQTINKLLKSSNYCGFVSKDQRFMEKNHMSPGPGEYYEDIYTQQILQEKDKNTANFKQKIRSQNQDNPIVKQTKKQPVLHSLKDKIQQIQPVKPGFGTSSPKSIIIKKQKFFGSHKNFINKEVKQMKENKHPFNNSTRKDINLCMGEGVGVGSYETQTEWNTKSFNILFH